MNSFTSQVGQIVRRLWRTPVFTVTTLITLAAGVGATITVFSVVEGVLLMPLPYPHPESLVGLWHTAPGLNLDEVNMAPSNYFIYREQNRTFEDVGIYQGDSVRVTGAGNRNSTDSTKCEKWKANTSVRELRNRESSMPAELLKNEPQEKPQNHDRYKVPNVADHNLSRRSV